jgi:hypothetical protein
VHKTGSLALAAVWLLASCTTHPSLSTGGKAGSTHDHGQPQPASSVPVGSKARVVDVQTNPFAAPEDPSTVTYSPGLVSQPIDAAYLPEVDAAAAVKAATRIGFNAGLQPGVPTVTLRSVSVGYPGQSTYASHPAWLVIWHGSKPWANGPAGRKSQPAPGPGEVSHCIYVVVVNAVTGKAEDAWQLCGAGSR